VEAVVSSRESNVERPGEAAGAVTLADLAGDTRGAVYVEFLIAFMPVLVFFLCILQLALLFTVKIYSDHAAVQGARSAAVVFGDERKTYNNEPENQLSKRRMEFVRNAVLLTLAPLILDGTVSSVDVTYPRPDQPEGQDALSNRSISPMSDSGAQAMVRVNVDVMARCKIAFANRIACGGLLGLGDSPGFFALGAGVHKRIRSTSTYPYQGASYTYRNN
jgi:hypothetical protein